MINSRTLALGLVLAATACGDSDAGDSDVDADVNRPDAAIADPSTDEFTGDSLDPSWDVLRGELLDISVADGELHLVANQYSVWFNEEAGALIHKTVSGNFKATTSVKARKASDPSEFVGPDFQFGGLLALDPTTQLHNYVFIVVGDRGGYLSVETKSTINSSSDVQGPEWPSGDAELRLCRVGADFFLYKREIGDTTWTEAVSYTRQDLPTELHVGPFAYAFNNAPDIRASFARVSITPVLTQADCTVD